MKKGTQQGDLVSSPLFNTVLHCALEDDLKKCKTIKKMMKLREVFCGFKRCIEKVVLEIHPSKTKILSNQEARKQKEITVDNIKIEFFQKKKKNESAGRK